MQQGFWVLNKIMIKRLPLQSFCRFSVIRKNILKCQKKAENILTIENCCDIIYQLSVCKKAAMLGLTLSIHAVILMFVKFL